MPEDFSVGSVGPLNQQKQPKYLTKPTSAAPTAPEGPEDFSIGAVEEPKPAKPQFNLDEAINRHAQRTNLDPNLIRAVIRQESGRGFNPGAVSPKNAQGLMQLIPATAARFKVKNPFDPEENIRGGTDYLKWLSDRYNGNLDRTLRAYNAGEGAEDAGKAQHYAETKNYLYQIKKRLSRMSAPEDFSIGAVDTDQSATESQPQPQQPSAEPAQAPTMAPVQRSIRKPKAPAAAAPTGVSVSDISWHFGMTPEEFKSLSAKQQNRVISIAQKAVANDEAKKKAGVVLQPSLDYINANRARIGLNAKSIMSQKGLPTSEEQGRSQYDLMPLMKNLASTAQGKGVPLHKALEQLETEREVGQFQQEAESVPIVPRVLVQELNRFAGKAERAIAGMLDYSKYLPNAGLSKDSLASDVSDYLKKRSEIALNKGNYETEDIKNSLPRTAVKAVADAGMDLASLIAITRATGISFPTVMAGEAALNNSDKDPKTIAKESAKAYALGRLYEYLPGKVAEKLKVTGQVGTRALGAGMFGAAGAGQTALEGGDTRQVLSQGIAQGAMGLLGGPHDVLVKEGAGVRKATAAERKAIARGESDLEVVKPETFRQKINRKAKEFLQEPSTEAQPEEVKAAETPAEIPIKPRTGKRVATPEELELLKGISKAQKERRSAERAGEIDELTGVANQKALIKALPAAEADPDTTIISTDIGNLKAANTVLGRKEGDRAIKDAAAALKQAAEENGVNRVFRDSGDEHLALAPNDKAETIAKRAKEIFKSRKAGDYDVTLDIGLGQTRKEADAQLKSVKGERKNSFRKIEEPKATLSSEEIIKNINRLNSGQPDQEATRQLLANKTYQLEEIPISDVKGIFGKPTAKRVTEYSKKPAESQPPIVIDSKGQVIDGKHRLAAAKLRGDTTIKAWKPVEGEREKLAKLIKGGIKAAETKESANAVSERSTETPTVGKAPGSSKKVGARVPRTEEPTNAQKAESEGVTQPETPSLVRSVQGQNGETIKAELTTENAKKFDELTQKHLRARDGYLRDVERGVRTKQEADKLIKASALRTAAEKRKLHKDFATPKEAEKATKREASNYVGKTVYVDGEPVTVIGNAFGKVKIKSQKHGAERVVNKSEISEKAPELEIINRAEAVPVKPRKQKLVPEVESGARETAEPPKAKTTPKRETKIVPAKESSTREIEASIEAPKERAAKTIKSVKEEAAKEEPKPESKSVVIEKDPDSSESNYKVYVPTELLPAAKGFGSLALPDNGRLFISSGFSKTPEKALDRILYKINKLKESYSAKSYDDQLQHNLEFERVATPLRNYIRKQLGLEIKPFATIDGKYEFAVVKSNIKNRPDMSTIGMRIKGSDGEFETGAGYGNNINPKAVIEKFIELESKKGSSVEFHDKDIEAQFKKEVERQKAVAEEKAAKEKAEEERVSEIRRKQTAYDAEVNATKLPTGKKEKIKLAVREDVDNSTAEGTVYPGTDWSIHKLDLGGKQKPEYVITHVPSGLRAYTFSSLGEAKKIVQAYIHAGLGKVTPENKEAMALLAKLTQYHTTNGGDADPAKLIADFKALPIKPRAKAEKAEAPKVKKEVKAKKEEVETARNIEPKTSTLEKKSPFSEQDLDAIESLRKKGKSNAEIAEELSARRGKDYSEQDVAGTETYPVISEDGNTRFALREYKDTPHEGLDEHKFADWRVEGNRVLINEGAARLISSALRADGHIPRNANVYGFFSAYPRPITESLRRTGIREAVKLANDIDAAAYNKDKTVVVASGVGALLHEGLHEQTYTHSINKFVRHTPEGMAEMTNHKAWGRIYKTLKGFGYVRMGLNPEQLVDEGAAHIANNYRELGISQADAVSWMSSFFRSFTDRNGRVSLEKFEGLVNEAEQARQQVRKEKGPVQTDGALRGMAEGRGRGSKEETGGEQPTLFSVKEREAIKSKKFKDWFEDSKVVDEHGEPLRVYHGTTANFEDFKNTHLGKNRRAVGTDALGHWFANTPEGVEEYIHNPAGEGFQEGANIRPSYLSIKNPVPAKDFADINGRDVVNRSRNGEPITGDEELFYTWVNNSQRQMREQRKRFIEHGFDGAIFDMGDGKKLYVAFEPQNVRSVFKGQEGFLNFGDIVNTALRGIAKKVVSVTEEKPKAAEVKAERPSVEKEREFPKSAEKAGHTKATDLTYDELSNETSRRIAQERIDTLGAEKAMRKLAQTTDVGAEEIATGLLLAKKFAKEGNTEDEVAVIDDLARKLTKAGQAVQAASMVSRLSPEGTLIRAQSILNKKAPGTRLTKEQTQDFKKTSEAIKGATERRDRAAAQEARIRSGEGGSIHDKLEAKLLVKANEARAKLESLRKQIGAFGLQKKLPQVLAKNLHLYSAIGAHELAKLKGVQKLERWKAEMVKVDPRLKPYLTREVFTESYKLYDETRKAILQASRERSAQKSNPNATSKELQAIINEKLDAQTQARRESIALKQMYDQLGAPNWKKNLRIVGDTIGLWRALEATADLSGSFRQTKAALLRHPVIWGKAFKNQIKGFNTKQYDRMISQLQLDPEFKYASRFGLDLTGMGEHEEGFQSGFAQKIPGAKHSEQAYTIMLDYTRMGWFKQYADGLRRLGLDPDNPADAHHFEAGARLINNATGRGDWGKEGAGKFLRNASGALNQALFSPRFLASRLTLLKNAVDPRVMLSPKVVNAAAKDALGLKRTALSNEARVEAFKTITSFTALVGMQLALAKLSGAKVSLDSEDPDFLKAKWGKYHVDLSAGMQGNIRLFLRLFSAVNHAEKGGPGKGETAGGILLDFGRKKLSPVASIVADMFLDKQSKGFGLDWTGQDFLKNPEYMFGKKGAGWNRANPLSSEGSIFLRKLVPMVIDDVKNAVYDTKPDAGAVPAIAGSILGEGVQTYEPKKKQTRGRLMF